MDQVFGFNWMLHGDFGGKQDRKWVYYVHSRTVKEETINTANKKRTIEEFGSDCLGVGWEIYLYHSGFQSMPPQASTINIPWILVKMTNS